MKESSDPIAALSNCSSQLTGCHFVTSIARKRTCRSHSITIGRPNSGFIRDIFYQVCKLLGIPLTEDKCEDSFTSIKLSRRYRKDLIAMVYRLRGDTLRW